MLSWFKRAPDLVIGDDYLLRWYIIPRNKYFNMYLHCFLGSDDPRALHDHPWWSVSFLLKGVIQEHTMNFTPEPTYCVKPVYWLLPKFRGKLYAHRIELKSNTAWTLFITGPRRRDWGFLCPKGWVPWQQFTDESGSQIGRGCE